MDFTPEQQTEIDKVVAAAVEKANTESKGGIEKAVAEAVSGLKNKNSELIGNISKQKDTLKAWEGLDPVKVRELLLKFDTDEEGQLIAAGKVDEVFERRTTKLNEGWQIKLDAAVAETAKEKEKTNKFTMKVLDEQIRAAVGGKLHEGAVDDAMLRARQIFTVDENGMAVQMKEGEVVMGKDGSTPYSPAEWIEAMREKSPHWFPATASGTGAQPNKGDGRQKTIKRADFDKMSPVEQAGAAKESVIVD